MENNQKQNLQLIKDLGMMYATETSKQKKRFCIYKCTCGKEFKAQFANVKNEITKSCGCSKGKMITESKITHGKARTRIFKIWVSIKRRCYSKNNTRYNDWGGRGIKVCEEWKNDFISFYNWAVLSGYNDSLSIDRIDNNGNYEPSNCRWTTQIVQSRNTRTYKTNTSGYRGIGHIDRSTKWKAQICVNYKTIYLGSFDTKEEAAKAYNDYVILNKLEHTLNIIKED